MSSTKLTIPISSIIQAGQLEHGLKYENYNSYSSYCSRRLHRLRRSLNVYQSIDAKAKARHQRARKFMNINTSMVIEAGDYAERVVLIQLYLAERAWAYAMYLKQESPEFPRKKGHSIRRLKKAAEYARKFIDLCNDTESPCSDRTKEEATAYGSYIVGLYKVEHGEWAEAKEHLYKSLRIYLKLSINLDYDLSEKVTEIKSHLKYCLFNLGEKQKNEIELPKNLQFIDIAARHCKGIQEEQAHRSRQALEAQIKVDNSEGESEHKEDEDTSQDEIDEEFQDCVQEDKPGLFSMFSKLSIFKN